MPSVDRRRIDSCARLFIASRSGLNVRGSEQAKVADFLQRIAVSTHCRGACAEKDVASGQISVHEVASSEMGHTAGQLNPHVPQCVHGERGGGQRGGPPTGTRFTTHQTEGMRSQMRKEAAQWREFCHLEGKEKVKSVSLVLLRHDRAWDHIEGLETITIKF